ncbi:hypothetical protein V6N12_005357 [Hibiscus sabdariffa]|uniref:F-box domain-containing protein n=1 Tax=Hibiscus sabdariffa TaxID=183260 RepID=A0ABR2CPL2_9ROSI
MPRTVGTGTCLTKQQTATSVCSNSVHHHSLIHDDRRIHHQLLHRRLFWKIRLGKGMATSESRTKRSENYKERPNSKRLQIEKQGPNWSDIPCDIVECIIRYLGLEDRIRTRAVCKGWSVANCHIPAIAAIDRFPWALKKFGSIYGDYRLLDPFLEIYGWVLFGCYLALPPQRKLMLFLYSPFTSEVIKLPELKSWKSLELNSGIKAGRADSAIYANGVFYCYFLHGQLVGFNVEPEEWTVLVGSSNSLPLACNLVMIDADLCVFDQYGLKLKLFKFDFSEMRWVYEKDLNKHALFMGCSSFSVLAVGETSDLANSIVSYKNDFGNQPLWSIRWYGYGSRSSKRKWLQRTGSLFHSTVNVSR